MAGYLATPFALDVRLAPLLGIEDQSSGNYVHTTPERLAHAVADLTYLDRPSTPQAVETLCELILALQESGMLNSTRLNPVFVIGGTMETGWPIDPSERLRDCVIAAADLGMFDPVASLSPEQDKAGPAFRVVSRSHDAGRDDYPWPISEGLPDGTSSEFSPIGGHWIAARRAAYDRLALSQPDPPFSTHAQFLMDLDYFLSAIVDLITQAMHQAGVIDLSHPG
jgi:hypothetical protein